MLHFLIKSCLVCDLHAVENDDHGDGADVFYC